MNISYDYNGFGIDLRKKQCKQVFNTSDTQVVAREVHRVTYTTSHWGNISATTYHPTVNCRRPATTSVLKGCATMSSPWCRQLSCCSVTRNKALS